MRLIAALIFLFVDARAAELIAGMNVVNPMRAKLADQNATLEQLKGAGVKVIRCGISPDEKGIDYAKRVKAHGIRLDLIVSAQDPPNAPKRAYQPEKFPNMWGGTPLSYADPELSRTYFKTLLTKLDESGIELAALELGNEINWSAFNPEFPLPGKGKIFSYQELKTDPEAKQIAKGYLQYIKIAEVLKEVRDASSVNRRTPIISAGLSNPGPARTDPKGKEDAVTINATLQFLHEHGLDKSVDAYGVHEYPWQNTPRARKASLENNVVARCTTANSTSGKPCWITEWGYNNASEACPLNDGARAALVNETMGELRQLAKQGRVLGEIYFSWNSDPWSAKPSASCVFRCGSLTKSGKIALTP